MVREDKERSTQDASFQDRRISQVEKELQQSQDERRKCVDEVLLVVCSRPPYLLLFLLDLFIYIYTL